MIILYILFGYGIARQISFCFLVVDLFVCSLFLTRQEQVYVCALRDAFNSRDLVLVYMSSFWTASNLPVSSHDLMRFQQFQPRHQNTRDGYGLKN